MPYSFGNYTVVAVLDGNLLSKSAPNRDTTESAASSQFLSNSMQRHGERKILFIQLKLRGHTNLFHQSIRDDHTKIKI